MVKKQLQCLWCIPEHQTQTNCFPTKVGNKLVSHKLYQPVVKARGSPGVDSTINQANFLEFSCTERETGEGKLVETVLQKLPMQPAVQI